MRDEKVHSLAEVIKDNIGSLPEIVQNPQRLCRLIVKFTLGERCEMLVNVNPRPEPDPFRH